MYRRWAIQWLVTSCSAYMALLLVGLPSKLRFRMYGAQFVVEPSGFWNALYRLGLFGTPNGSLRIPFLLCVAWNASLDCTSDSRGVFHAGCGNLELFLLFYYWAYNVLVTSKCLITFKLLRRIELLGKTTVICIAIIIWACFQLRTSKLLRTVPFLSW